MKKQFFYLLVGSMLFVFCCRSSAKNLMETGFPGSYGHLSSDSIPTDISFVNIKINPIQLLFSEIPVAFEIFLPKDRSLQLQLGFIFPQNESSGLRKFFESSGTNGDASSEGLVSYRTSPFNNYGFSVKFEIRKYGKSLYFGPQFMYKSCFYRKTVFPVYGGNITLNQTENKTTNILGIGFVTGLQTDNNEFVFDWYAAFGFRVRAMSVTVLKIENPAYKKGTSYPNSTEDFFNFYPFINLGVRIGFQLWKNTYN